jgi:ribokinase
MGGVLVVGSYVQDHAWLTDTFPQVGETRKALGFHTGPGGKGFNQAVAAVRQGVPTRFIGAIGDDALGRVARQFAADEGLPALWQVCTDAPTAASSIVVDQQGRNLIVVNLAANERLDATFVAAQTAEWADASVLLAQLENRLDTVADVLAEGRRRGLLTVLNPAPMHAGLRREHLADVDVLTPNETEFAALLAQLRGIEIAADRLAHFDDAQLALFCAELGVPTVVLTLGAAGCFVAHGPQALAARGDASAYYRLPAESVCAIDTTGAGDAFSGALCAALAGWPTRPFATAVRHANRVAALSTEAIGTAPAMPSLARVHERFGASP